MILNRLLLFPDTTTIENDSLAVAGQSLVCLADFYGTPLYIYDRATLDNALAEYRSALEAYPAPASITYAGKAFLCKAIVQWTQQQGLWLDCTGEGELAIASASGATRERVLVHGVNKSDADLRAAFGQAGTIVVDNLSELARLASLDQRQDMAELWLRLQPGIAVETHHAHTQTGHFKSKFGMTPEELLEAAQVCKRNGLPLTGIHFHQGSNFRDASPLRPAIDLALDLALEIGLGDEWHFSPGGGWGVSYHEDELPNPSIVEYVHTVTDRVIQGCRQRDLPLPHLHLEPGRSLVARAGVSIYRVGAVKQRGDRTWLLADGGMADNPRHALYGTRYSCLTVAGPGRERSERVSIAGPFCESGDVILEDLPMPKVEPGELIAVPVSGAYQLSMSSNYNGARRPAVVWLKDGQARLIVKRETVADLLRRDVGL